MKRWWSAVSLLGAGCSSLCFLGLPLIAIWLPASGFGWLHNERLTRAMLLMFLAMTLAGNIGAFRAHRKPGPGLCALAGALFITGTAWNVFSARIGWAALAGLLGAWLWDRRLLKEAPHLGAGDLGHSHG